jgi:hypothetical protein
MRKFGICAIVLASFVLSFCCEKAPSDPAPATLDGERQRLYSAISGPYCLDGASYHPLRTLRIIGFAAGMRKVASSSEPFVSKLAQGVAERSAVHRAMYRNAQNLRSNAPIVILPLVKDRLDDDLQKTGQDFLNSPFAVKNTLASAIECEANAQSIDEMVAAYSDILSDARSHPRGAPTDRKAFALEYVARGQSGQVYVTLHNNTSQVLHNTLIVGIVKHDPAKVRAKHANDGVANILTAGAVGAGDDFQKAQDDLQKAKDHLVNTDGGLQVFIPEWKQGQSVEMPLDPGLDISVLLSGELSIFSDEATSTPIPLEPEKMSASLSHPIELNPNEDASRQAEQDEADHRNSVVVSESNGSVIYRLQVYQFWSEQTTQITVPAGMQSLTVAWEPGTDIQVNINGYYNFDENIDAAANGHINAAKINCTNGDRLSFRTNGSNDPVAVAVRFLQREATDEEKAHLELLPTQEELKKAQESRRAAMPPATVVQPTGAAPMPAPKPARPSAPWKSGDQLPSADAPQIAGAALEISAEVDSAGASGVIVSQGASVNGYAMYLNQGRLAFSVRENAKLTTIEAENPLGAGHFALKATIQKDGALALFVDGQQVAEGKAGGPIPRQPVVSFIVGSAAADGEVVQYPMSNVYAGKITNVNVKVTAQK